MKCRDDLLKQSQHIHKLITKQTSQELDNVWWLAFQGCAFKGHDESVDSQNRGNFVEMIKLLATYNEKVANVILENSSQKNAKYCSNKIQKEILHIFASKVRAVIREQIRSAKIYLMVDKARDESKIEQMAIILRFADVVGFIRECFFCVVHVKDTTSLNLKIEICKVLSRYNFQVENIRGQGYDGVSNMRGEWNGLQALFLKDCPYTYYVHCMAHRLQLDLVSTSREVKQVHQFFNNLTLIINIVVGSSKRNDELQDAQASAIENMIANDEIDTGKGLNQVGTLQRACDTRWSSHFNSICSLLRMFGATCSMIDTISREGANYSIRGDADGVYQVLTSFEFVFILHLMKQIMGITDVLYRALQQKSQDILNAMQLVSTTKALIQKFRDDGWETLLENDKEFCSKNDIDIPDLEGVYGRPRNKSRQHGDSRTTLKYHFKLDIFCATIDRQLQELDSRFSDQTLELLTLSLSLSPKV